MLPSPSQLEIKQFDEHYSPLPEMRSRLQMALESLRMSIGSASIVDAGVLDTVARAQVCVCVQRGNPFCWHMGHC